MTDSGYTITFEERPGDLVARVAGPSDSVSIKVNCLTEVAAEQWIAAVP